MKAQTPKPMLQITADSKLLSCSLIVPEKKAVTVLNRIRRQHLNLKKHFGERVPGRRYWSYRLHRYVNKRPTIFMFDDALLVNIQKIVA